MPYCPRCRDEFREHVKSCPDCGVALVEESPPQVRPSERHPSQGREPLVRIATAPNEPLSQFWTAILEDNGIRCLVKPETSSGVPMPIISGVIPSNFLQFDIYVSGADAKKAREILDGLQADNAETRQ